MEQTRIIIFERGKTFFETIKVEEKFDFMGFSFSVHKDYKNDKVWIVTENLSGAVASHPQDENGKGIDKFKGHKNKKDAINTAKENIKNFVSKGGNLNDNIRKFINRWHPKPKFIGVLDLIKLKIIR